MKEIYIAIYDKGYSDNVVIKKTDSFWAILSDVIDMGYFEREISRNLCYTFPKFFLDYLQKMPNNTKDIISYLYGFKDGKIRAKSELSKAFGHSNTWAGNKANDCIRKIARKLWKIEYNNTEQDKVYVYKLSMPLVRYLKEKNINDIVVIKEFIKKEFKTRSNIRFLRFLEEHATINVVEYDDNGDIIPNFDKAILKDYGLDFESQKRREIELIDDELDDYDWLDDYNKLRDYVELDDPIESLEHTEINSDDEIDKLPELLENIKPNQRKRIHEFPELVDRPKFNFGNTIDELADDEEIMNRMRSSKKNDPLDS